jgi:membrane protein implicated in regulation of membrane protease activity
MWWVWMALAGLFIMGEIFRNGSFFLWLGFGAAASGILALLDIQTPGQIAVFINISGILILLERRFLERYTFKQPPRSISSSDDGVDLNVLRRAGAGWEIKFGGKSYTIRHSKGLLHIRNLIIKKGEWIHCSVLKRLSSDDVSENKYEHYAAMTREQLEGENLRVEEGAPPEDIIALLPLEKIKKLRDALVERKVVDDFKSPEEKIDQLNTLDFIEKYLKKVTDNKGRPRKIHDLTDTDRKAVSAAINRCRNNLKEHKELYTHFKSFIQAEGNAFRYLPDRPVDWKTE